MHPDTGKGGGEAAENCAASHRKVANAKHANFLLAVPCRLNPPMFPWISFQGSQVASRPEFTTQEGQLLPGSCSFGEVL